jgi:nucleotide-binding universal stress UspA family protein
MYSHPLLSGPSATPAIPALLRDWSAARETFLEMQPVQRLLVPVDGTPAAISAVEHVIAHADTARTHVHLINVQPPIMAGEVSPLSSARMATDLRRSVGEQALRAAKALLHASGIEHTSEVVFGATAEAIVRGAAERGSTKIVMGSRSTDTIGHIVRRSVSSRVVRLAHIPVTIVKAPARARAR